MRVRGPSIDWAAFGSCVQLELYRSNVSLRDLMDTIGVHHSTLCRAANGKSVSAEVYLALCLWMEEPPMRFWSCIIGWRGEQ